MHTFHAKVVSLAAAQGVAPSARRSDQANSIQSLSATRRDGEFHVLGTIIDKMNDELSGDLSRLVVVHDIERWKGHKVVKDVDRFKIVEIE